MKTYTLRTTRISDNKIVESGHFRRWRDAENLQRDPMIDVLHSAMRDNIKTEVIEHDHGRFGGFFTWLMAA